MIVIYLVSAIFLLPTLASAEDVSPKQDNQVATASCITKNIMDWIENGLMEEITDALPSGRTFTEVEGRLKKKGKLNKYVLPLLIGFLLIKSILLPIALKALAVLSGKAVILSLMSLVLAAIVGLKKIAHSGDKSVDIVTVPLSSKYRRKDMYYDWEEAETEDPYGYYRDRPIDRHRINRYDMKE